MVIMNIHLHTTYKDEIEYPTTVTEADMIDAVGKHVNQQSVPDFMINDEISLTQGEKSSMGKVILCAVNKHSKLIGIYNGNPILNSH